MKTFIYIVIMLIDMRNLRKILSIYKKEIILAPLFKLAEAALELVIPIIVADIIDRGVNGKDVSAVYGEVSLMLVLAAVGLGFSIAGQYFSARAATGFSHDVRSRLYSSFLSRSAAYTDKIGVSAMVTRMTSDLDRMQSGVNLTLRLLLRSPLVVFGAFIAAAIINLRISLVVLSAIIVLFVVVGIIMRASAKRYYSAQQKLDDASLIARENLTGVRVIRAFGAEKDETEKFNAFTAMHEKLLNAAAKISLALNPLTFAIVNLAVIAIFFAGGKAVDNGVISQGKVVALYDYMSQILVELVKLASLTVTVSRALASARRIESILSFKEEKPTATEATSNAYIEYRSVSVNYGTVRALCDVSFTVNKGETIGVIGGTGSGKSTLVNLLPRIYDCSDGEVIFQGKDVKSYDEKYLRNIIGIALQKPALMKGTIRSNILMGNPEATDEDVARALNLAQCDDIIAAKSNGIDEEVEQGGRNFSGGQRQRLALARAIVKNPEILILDDTSSALDYLTDLKLRRALKTLENTTTFIVSQRTSTVKGADKIIVLSEGKIVGEGTHAELMDNCPLYREIALSQTKEAL